MWISLRPIYTYTQYRHISISIDTHLSIYHPPQELMSPARRFMGSCPPSSTHFQYTSINWKTILYPVRAVPTTIHTLLTTDTQEARHFREHIFLYGSSLAFASMVRFIISLHGFLHPSWWRAKDAVFTALYLGGELGSAVSSRHYATTVDCHRRSLLISIATWLK